MSVSQVIKRNGTLVPFDRRRIENAIYAAARATESGERRPWAEALSWAVVGILEDRYRQNGHAPHVEEIQDLVEEVLIKSGSPQVAKKHTLYRYERAKARESERMLLDADRLVDDYIQRADWRVNENSNMNYSLQGLNFYLASSIAARYWLHKIYPSEVQEAHVDGDLHLHDLGMLSVYCCGWDLHDLLIQGFGRRDHQYVSAGPSVPYRGRVYGAPEGPDGDRAHQPGDQAQHLGALHRTGTLPLLLPLP